MKSEDENQSSKTPDISTVTAESPRPAQERSRCLVKKEIGWPDEMQARFMIIDACKRAGSKSAFCRQIGLSRRYLSLILEWKRAPVHRAILSSFGWEAVYMMAEDLLDTPQHRRKLGSRKTHPMGVEEQRRYWKQKQTESRLRRKGGDACVM